MDTLAELQTALIALDTQNRRKAAATAFRLKEPALLPALLAALTDQYKDFDIDRRTRSWILWFIPYDCADSVVETVRYIADNDPNPSIREHALSQFKRLTK